MGRTTVHTGNGKGYDEDLRMKLWEADREYRLKASQITDIDREWAKYNVPAQHRERFLQMVSSYRFRGMGDAIYDPKDVGKTMAQNYHRNGTYRKMIERNRWLEKENKRIEKKRQEREEFWSDMASSWKWPWQK